MTKAGAQAIASCSGNMLYLRDPQRIYSILYISLYDTREHIELDLNLQVKLSLWAMTSDHVQNQLRLKRVREKGDR